MKLLSLLILVPLLQVSATGFSQNTSITIDMKSANLQDVLEEIERQSEYRFIYKDDLIDENIQYNVDINKRSIDNVLDDLFKNSSLTYRLLEDNLIVLAQKIMFSQEITVKGKVTDVNGIALPGVNIVEKGTSNGTITNIDGEYTILVSSPEAVLSFSFVGYLTEDMNVSGQTVLDISLMEDIQALDEVVVVGYGTQKKVSVTGSIASIGGDDLAKISTPNLTNAIAGQLPGVIANIRSGEPGEDDAKIFIRGKGTLKDNPEALIIIDGVPDRGGFSRLNPDDIESFTVLKDASAAIYGARAANGVILITTKRGAISKPVLSLNSSYSVSQPTRLPTYLDSYQYATAENEFRANFTGEAPRWTDDDLNKFRTGSSPLTHPNTNWTDVILKDWSAQTQHSLSLRGGTEKVKYFVSGQYLYQDGDFHGGTDYNQYQYRTNLDIQVTRDLTMGIDLSYRFEDRDKIPSTKDIWYELLVSYPYLVDYYPNGLPGVGLTRGQNLAILSTKEAGYNRDRSHIYNTKVDFKYDLSKLTEGLYVQGYGVFDRFNYDNKEFRKLWKEYAYDPSIQDYIEADVPRTRELYLEKSNSSRTTIHARLGYSRTIGNHDIDAFAAFEQNQYSLDKLTAFRNKFLSDDVDQLFAGADDQDKANYGEAEQSARLNYFGRIHYGFKEKYLADFTLRRDGSQNFPKNKRFGTFPGISVGWRISEESFFNLSFVDYLKIRASWGQMGDDKVDAYQYLTSYRLGLPYQWESQLYFFGLSGNPVKTFIADQTPNANITWEVATTENIGIDATLFDGQLNFTGEFFHSMRESILIKRNESVPAYSGLKLPDENLGKVENKGVELELTHIRKVGNDFSYTIGGNFTFVRNKVVYLDEPEGLPEQQRKEGYPVDSWVVYQTDGLFQTQAEVDNNPTLYDNAAPGDVKLVDSNNDGVISELDKKRLMSGEIPEIMYGINLGASYKGLDLSLLFQGQANAYLMVRPGQLNVPVEVFEGRWQKEGDNNYPRTFYGPMAAEGQSREDSDFWLKDASFVRLKNAQLAYTLPVDVSKKIGFQKVRFYVAGTNLFTLDKIKIFDPELDSGTGATYPLQRVVRFGINLSL